VPDGIYYIRPFGLMIIPNDTPALICGTAHL